MKYFKDKKTGEVYAYGQEQIDGGWVKEGLVQMTKKETEAHLNPVPTTEQLAGTARAERDRLIESVRWRIERHNDELALGSEPTEPLEPLLQYVQDLRDVPRQSGFPGDIDWPVNPQGAAMKGAHDATTN